MEYLKPLSQQFTEQPEEISEDVDLNTTSFFDLTFIEYPITAGIPILFMHTRYTEIDYMRSCKTNLNKF